MVQASGSEGLDCGCSSLNTTALYTQVATSTIRGMPSSLDRLRLEVTPPPQGVQA